MPGINADGGQLLLGRGKIYFDRKDAAGKATGERFLGECSAFEVSGSPETRDKYTNTNKTSGLLKRAVIRQAWEFSFEMNEYAPENCALALLGETSTLSQLGTPVVDFVVGPSSGVQLDRWYQLGSRLMTAFSAKLGSTTLTIDTDYKVDLAHGRVLWVSGGAVTAGATTAKVSFTPTVKSYTQVLAGLDPIIEGKLVFIGDNVVGDNYHFEAWVVHIQPDGALALISDDYGNPKLKGSVLLDDTNHPTSPYFTATLIDIAS